MTRALEILTAAHAEKQARDTNVQSSLSEMRKSAETFQSIRASQQKSKLQELELAQKIANAPIDLLNSRAKAADSLSKLHDAGLLSDQQFDQGLSQLNSQSLKTNLAKFLNDPATVASTTNPASAPSSATTNTQSLTPSQAKKQKVLEDQQIKAQGEALKQTAKTEAEDALGAEKGITGSVRFIQQLERSEKELLDKGFEEFGKVGIEGKAQRLGLSFLEKLDELPETSTLVTESLVIANQTARDIEGGRVTDDDRKIYADALANTLKRPSSENIRLTSNSLIRLADKGGNLKPVLEAFADSESQLIQSILIQTLEGLTEEQRNSLING